MASVILSDGDTPDWVRLETNISSSGIVSSLLKLTLAGDAKRFDFRRKCWFIHVDVIDALIAGIVALLGDKNCIDDRRLKEEDFDSFFNNSHAVGHSAPSLSKEQLLGEFIAILMNNRIDYMGKSGATPTVSELKPYYRKAALALHPDRNNGDGSKMSHLNMIWAQLRQLG